MTPDEKLKLIYIKGYVQGLRESVNSEKMQNALSVLEKKIEDLLNTSS